MRKIATNPDPNTEFRRLMIYDTGDDGVYLFLFHSLDDGPSDADYWYEDVAAADRHAAEFGVEADDWEQIPDPRAGCQDDWLTPTRVRLDASGLRTFEPLSE